MFKVFATIVVILMALAIIYTMPEKGYDIAKYLVLGLMLAGIMTIWTSKGSMVSKNE